MSVMFEIMWSSHLLPAKLSGLTRTRFHKKVGLCWHISLALKGNKSARKHVCGHFCGMKGNNA